ncbi:MAG: low molecular weight protein-tyrosine-phosphatase [Chloroherpetonaceae bacterium]
MSNTSSSIPKLKILFVCLGNICRSPTAEAVFRKLVESEGLSDYFEIDSAGTAGYHIGDMADARSIRHAQKRGYDLTAHRGRRLEAEDLDAYDYIITMDKSNYADVSALCTTQWRKLKSFMDFAPDSGYTEVPDPYSKGSETFELVLDLCEVAAKGLLEHLKAKHLSHVQGEHKA